MFTKFYNATREHNSIKSRCMEMSDKFCAMHLKYVSCVSLLSRGTGI